jgi:multimeric flavodoxin WrbA
MKVLALNGSPRMKASSTYHMLTPLLEGMQAAGAETELIHIRKLDLEACIGCYTCWVRTPGECIHKDKDNMVAAMEYYNTADLVIFGTPLYHLSMSGIMKTFIDRTLPRIEPWLIPHPDIPGVTFHTERFHKPDKIMLVSPFSAHGPHGAFRIPGRNPAPRSRSPQPPLAARSVYTLLRLAPPGW